MCWGVDLMLITGVDNKSTTLTLEQNITGSICVQTETTELYTHTMLLIAYQADKEGARPENGL